MASTDQKHTPFGLYILSGLILLSILRILYDVLTSATNIYLALILVPLFVYMGIGILKRWPWAKDLVMVVAVLLFLGAIPNIVVAFLAEETRELAGTINIVEKILQFTVFPAVYFYFRKENVKAYFQVTT